MDGSILKAACWKDKRPLPVGRVCVRGNSVWMQAGKNIPKKNLHCGEI